MKAAVTTAPGRMEIRELTDPVPQAGEALIKVEVVGICGSDLHFYEGENPYANYPQTQGHEFSGRVVAFGPPGDGSRGGDASAHGVSAPGAATMGGPARVGQRVAVEPLIPCGECYPCRKGRPNCCTQLKVMGIHVPGAFAEYVVVPVNTLHVADDLDPELTSLVEPISIGMQVVTRGTVAAADTVAVYGAGMIGQAVLACAADRGARVLVVDKVASRLELARRLGAERVVDATQDDPAAVIADWTGGDGAAVVVDATGAPAVIRSAVDVVAYAGRIVIVGISMHEVSLPIPLFTRKELTILGSRNNAGVFGQAVDLVRRQGERLRVLITQRYPLAQAPEAIDFALHNPAVAEKVLLTVAEGGGAP